jgi:multidrug efflux system membrane fusion protein
MKRCRVVLAVCSLLLAAAGGCHRNPEPVPQTGPQVVPVSRPVEREVAYYVYYTGRTEAVQSVDVRARVTGYLVKMPFKEGEEVKVGDLLFVIDPRPYQAQHDAYKAQVELKDANRRLAEAEFARSKAINRNVPGTVSAEAIEQAAAKAAQAVADLNVAKANLHLAELDLEYTKVASPIDGQVSRYYLTLGNLVTQDQTLLTTVVSVDPMHVYFDADERTVLRVRKAINEGKIQPQKAGEIPVNMALEGEEGFTHHGTINFVNNRVNLSTGTITVRGVFANPLPPGGRRLLVPGMFVRIQVPIGPPRKALLVIDRALGSDQGLRYLYPLDDRDTVQYRRVRTGPLQDDGLRVIEEGLKPDDRVVVGAILQVRPRMKVEPEMVPMPTIGPPAGDGAPARGGAPPSTKGAGTSK